MDLFFDGPDGPINAFSKERGSLSLAGLGYRKIVPTEGYRYHVYMMPGAWGHGYRSEEHTSELQSQSNLVCRLLLEKKNITRTRSFFAIHRYIPLANIRAYTLIHPLARAHLRITVYSPAPPPRT